MSNHASITNENSGKYVQATSRYLNSKILKYSLLDRDVLTFETYKQKPKSLRGGEWVTIGASHEYRPDRLSYEVFGTPDFWWKIMEHNNMKDILEFKEGVNIKLPWSVMDG
jgi:hypothetical protein